MLLFTAAIAVILFVLQLQVDLLVAEPQRKSVKVILFVLAIVAVLYQRFA